MPLSANSSAVLNVSMNSLTSGQNACLRGGISKETEDLTLVPTRHRPPAIPIAPLHIWTPPVDQVRAVSGLLLLGKQKFRSSRCLPCRNGLDGDERRGSRRHTYLRPLSLEPTWAPGQDENRTRGANRCATA